MIPALDENNVPNFFPTFTAKTHIPNVKKPIMRKLINASNIIKSLNTTPTLKASIEVATACTIIKAKVILDFFSLCYR